MECPPHGDPTSTAAQASVAAHKMRMLITELSEESMFPASETIDEKSSARAWTSVLIARPLCPKNKKQKRIHHQRACNLKI